VCQCQPGYGEILLGGQPEDNGNDGGERGKYWDQEHAPPMEPPNHLRPAVREPLGSDSSERLAEAPRRFDLIEALRTIDQVLFELLTLVGGQISHYVSKDKVSFLNMPVVHRRFLGFECATMRRVSHKVYEIAPWRGESRD
jgi:hypothetical protein